MEESMAVSLLTGYGQTARLQTLYGTTTAKRVIDPASGRKYF
jgi:hypothetical protein